MAIKMNDDLIYVEVEKSHLTDKIKTREQMIAEGDDCIYLEYTDSNGTLRKESYKDMTVAEFWKRIYEIE